MSNDVINNTSHIEKPAKLTGILKNDSPALFRRLKEFISDIELAELAAIFKRTFELYGHNEAPVLRAEGASYNPKPARLCSILIQEFKERRASVLGGGFLICVDELSLKNGNGLPQISLALSLKAHSFMFSKGSKSTEEGLAVESIFLAKKLDEFRHLHMTSLSQKERARFVQDITEGILPFISLPEHERVKVLLDNLAQKYLRVRIIEENTDENINEEPNKELIKK